MAVPHVGQRLAHAVDGPPRGLIRIGRLVWWLIVTALAAAGQASCGYGSVHHLARSLYPEAFPAVPSDDAAVARYAAHGISQIEAYLVAVAEGPTP